jgi:hypothetical protein
MMPIRSVWLKMLQCNLLSMCPLVFVAAENSELTRFRDRNWRNTSVQLAAALSYAGGLGILGEAGKASRLRFVQRLIDPLLGLRPGVRHPHHRFSMVTPPGTAPSSERILEPTRANERGAWDDPRHDDQTIELPCPGAYAS